MTRAAADAGRPPGGRAARAAALAALLPVAACWRIGEPTEGPARVAWAAYPETVVVGEVFSFEFAGPVHPTACGRLDTAVVAVRDSTIELSARRSVYEAMCPDSPVAFYEARPLRLPAVGRWRVRTEDGLDLGALVAVDSGSFAPMRAVGEGTLGEAGGCRLFGPGWLGNQRPFALRGLPDAVAGAAGPADVVRVDGRLHGFADCGSFGSRPLIRVDSARATGERTQEWYGTG